MTIFAILFAVAIFGRYGAALQVTPNSPCASVCIDSNDLDFSDPNSSNTVNADISCYDKDYTSSPAGKKFYRCMSCLQDSSFSQGTENDQAWFLYNLRYTFDYCIFGFPNATDVASTPCSTSTACGGLQDALTEDDLHTNGLQPYGYCSADGGAMGGPFVDKCVACVAASDDQSYLANFMIALDAGCEQRPAAGIVVGLNDTVFSTTPIEAVSPTASATPTSRQSLPAATVAGIVVGIIAIIIAVSGFLFVRHRKQRNRRLRLEGSPKPNAPKRSHHRPASSLSFRCQTHLSPRSPAFFPSASESTIHEEMIYSAPIVAPSSNAVSVESSASKQPVWPPPKPGSRSERPFRGTGNFNVSLHNIATTAPTVPDGVHYSTSPKAKGFSPIDELVTPASTTSTKSTSQLLPLKPYNPAEYGISIPQMGGGPEAAYTSPTSGSTASPLISRAWDQKTPIWDKPLPPRVSSRPAVKVVADAVSGGKGKRVSNTGSPIETKEFNAKFPGPPPPKR